METQRDARVDDYIARAPEFARPILRHLRERVHAGCPGVEETVKWGRPFFACRGQVICNMAAFKAHCGFGFWHSQVAALVERDLGGGRADEGSGQFGRITRLEDLPGDATLARYLAEAVRLLESDKPARPRPAAGAARKPELPMPEDLALRLLKNPRAAAAFEKFSPSCRREYIEWITEAKREETRRKRLDTALEWMAEGKARHWKYQC